MGRDSGLESGTTSRWKWRCLFWSCKRRRKVSGRKKLEEKAKRKGKGDVRSEREKRKEKIIKTKGKGIGAN